MTTVDLLAIAAHRDDVELTCSGTLIKAARQGYGTAINKHTQPENGTRRTPISPRAKWGRGDPRSSGRLRRRVRPK